MSGLLTTWLGCSVTTWGSYFDMTRCREPACLKAWLRTMESDTDPWWNSNSQVKWRKHHLVRRKPERQGMYSHRSCLCTCLSPQVHQYDGDNIALKTDVLRDSINNRGYTCIQTAPNTSKENTRMALSWGAHAWEYVWDTFRNSQTICVWFMPWTWVQRDRALSRLPPPQYSSEEYGRLTHGNWNFQDHEQETGTRDRLSLAPSWRKDRGMFLEFFMVLKFSHDAKLQV